MPLELGIDLGCKRYGTGYLQEKVILVLDFEPYRFQRFISDIAGQDIETHENNPRQAVKAVRDWLRLELDPKLFKTSGARTIHVRYEAFQSILPTICAKLNWDIDSLPFADFSWAVYDWISSNPPK